MAPRQRLATGLRLAAQEGSVVDFGQQRLHALGPLFNRGMLGVERCLGWGNAAEMGPEQQYRALGAQLGEQTLDHRWADANGEAEFLPVDVAVISPVNLPGQLRSSLGKRFDARVGELQAGSPHGQSFKWKGEGSLRKAPTGRTMRTRMR